jgi:hypothetical protein
MSKFKYRLVEQEEGGEETSSGNKEKIVYDLVLTPLASSVQDAVAALEKIDNYGAYVSNIRNTKSDIEKAVIDQFGPSQPLSKKKAEKERGKPFPLKTKAAIDTFIKTLSTKPSLLKWKVVGDTLVFPSAGNPTKKVTEKIIGTVMDNAGLDYDLENKESVSESKKMIKENSLSNKISQAIENIDPNMSYMDFAIAVADIIKNDYGSHNIEPFMKVLHKELGLVNESKIKKLVKEEIKNLFENKNLSTAEKLIKQAEKEGHIKGDYSQSVLDAAKKIAKKWDELSSEEQKVMRDTYYQSFLKKIKK